MNRSARAGLSVLQAGTERLGITLDDRALDRFQRYHAILNDWNQRINLTSVVAWDSVVRTHFIDSLTVVAALPQITTHGHALMDVGSGAGFPGVPLKIVFPTLQLTLLEATGKKARFLEALLQELELHDVQVLNGRAEGLARQPGLREAFDSVVARAVAPMSALVELTLPFARIGGLVIAQKKGDFQSEIIAAGYAINALGGRVLPVQTLTLPELGEVRSLVLVEKIAHTPGAYPRRPGMPAKQPLVASSRRQSL
ncbi:MAG: 16S rRNA (guanine(527)-N(7))-methyltransferase RsmG [Dehalococcoidia bacterium]|nr:16S rRNA (guanine(527)-N(7))-methyltransferase RsmG [Dehalococcoidia bacterium]